MTDMVDVDLFLPQVLLYAPNVADLVAYRYIVEAARQLCERCKVWRDSDDFEITTPDMQGLITLPDAAIVSIEQASIDNIPLIPRTVPWLDKNLRGWDTTTDDQSQAKFVTQLAPDTVTVVPRVTGMMHARFVLEPIIDAETLPAFLLADYATDIGRGAVGKILTTPGQDANPQLGLSHTAWFEGRLDTLAVRATKGQQSAPLRTRGRYL